MVCDNFCLKISSALFIFTHYFEAEFESFQIYQHGQFFVRLSGYKTFLNTIFHDQRSSGRLKIHLFDSSHAFK